MGSEKHVMYTPASAITEEILFAILKFVRDSGQTTVRFSNDAGTDACYTGAGFVNASTIANAAAFGANSYMVIESVATMPGGERWQFKIKMDAPSADDIGVTVACTKAGGTEKWTNGAAAFHANQIKTGETLFGTGANPTATSKFMISASDMNTYDQHQFDGGAQTIVGYTYFRILWYDSALTEGNKVTHALRIGGYRPMEPHLDVNPWCVLIGRPNSGTSSLYWGALGVSTGTNTNRSPLEDGQTTLDLSATGFTRIVGTNNVATGEPSLTRGNKWAPLPVTLLNNTGGDVLGTFGAYDMLTSNVDRSDAVADSTAEYMTFNDLVFRWKP